MRTSRARLPGRTGKADVSTQDRDLKGENTGGIDSRKTGPGRFITSPKWFRSA